MRYITPVLAILVICVCVLPVAASVPPGGEGWLTINCNVDGATVYLDGVDKGTISAGSLDIENGVNSGTYTVKMDGYYDATGDIDYVPGGSPNLEITVSLTPKPTGSGKGWISVHSNVDGAAVAFNGVTKGTITGGVFTLEVSTTGTPYTKYSVSKDGYVTYTDSVSMPADGQTIDLYATLNPVPTSAPTTAVTTAATPIGGDAGWYKVSCNVNGASVYFDSGYMGVISGGSLAVPVYTTGTPYTTYRIEKNGYVTATGTLPSAPAKGKTVAVTVTLSPAGTATPTTEPVPSLLPGGGKGYLAIHANVDGATVKVGDETIGIITNGVLRVPVSTTGTPYSAFTVSKPGYVTTTGTVPRQPGEGETVDIYVTMSAEPATQVPVTESPVPVPLIMAAIAGAVIASGARRL